jgi:hypothetical protein
MPNRRALKIKKTTGEEIVLEIEKAERLPEGSVTVLMLSEVHGGRLKLAFCPRLIGEFAEIASIEVIREDA